MTIRVQVVLALPSAQEITELELPEGATLAEAVAAARLRERHPLLAWDRMTFGVWSRAAPPGHVLRDGDRVEAYRPLAADPKDQRRKRARCGVSVGCPLDPTERSW